MSFLSGVVFGFLLAVACMWWLLFLLGRDDREVRA